MASASPSFARMNGIGSKVTSTTEIAPANRSGAGSSPRKVAIKLAKQSGIGDRLFFHGVNVSGDIASLGSISGPKATILVTAINSATEERRAGIGDGKLSFMSYFNDDGAANRAAAAGSTFHELSQIRQTDVVLLYCRGAAIGSPCAALTAKQLNADPTRAADGSFTFQVDTVASGSPLEWGELLTAGQVTFASSGASAPAGIVSAAQTANGGVGFLQFESRDSGTPTFLIEDSADTTTGADGTWGTLLTFTNTGGASAFGERKTVTGIVEKGIRCGVPTGTYSNALVAVGFRRGIAQDSESLA